MHTEFAITSAVVEDLVNTILSVDASARERHLFRQSLLSLVRLAKVEYKAEMQTSLDKIVQALPIDATLVV